MSFDPYPSHSSEPELCEAIVKFVGGTTAVTKLFGKNMTTSYIGTGIVDLIWKESPGAFVGCTGHCFEATTQTALKGYTVVPGVWNAATNTLRINIFNSAFALTDLAALQWLTLQLSFKQAQSTL